MPTNRRPLKREYQPPLVVTDEALAAWRRAKSIRRKDSREYRDAEDALQNAIGMSKFHASPLGRGTLLGGETESPRLARAWATALEQADRADREAEAGR
jgi:hypothetical protein